MRTDDRIFSHLTSLTAGGNVLAQKMARSCNAAMTADGSNFAQGRDLQWPHDRRAGSQNAALSRGEGRSRRARNCRATRALGDRRGRPRHLWRRLRERYSFRRGMRAARGAGSVAPRPAGRCVRARFRAARRARTGCGASIPCARKPRSLSSRKTRRPRLTTTPFTPGPISGSSRRARREAGDPRKIHALLVWDEKPTGDGPGGTSDFQEKVCHLGGHLEIINPTRLP